jgi:hypothetical protein
MLSKAIGSTYIEFDDVEVPVENLLGKENHGFDIVMSSMFSPFRYRHTLTQASRFQPRKDLARMYQSAHGTCLRGGCVQLRHAA